MNKSKRKAVRCYLIKNNKVVAIKYKKGTPKEDYYDIPGGKIEDEETPMQAVIREMKEETSINISNAEYKGNIIIEYPNFIFDLDVFFSTEYKGEPQDSVENTSGWIDIKKLLEQEKLILDVMLLDKFFVKGLIDDKYNFNLKIELDEQENILNIDYKLKK